MNFLNKQYLFRIRCFYIIGDITYNTIGGSYYFEIAAERLENSEKAVLNPYMFLKLYALQNEINVSKELFFITPESEVYLQLTHKNVILNVFPSEIPQNDRLRIPKPLYNKYINDSSFCPSCKITAKLPLISMLNKLSYTNNQ